MNYISIKLKSNSQAYCWFLQTQRILLYLLRHRAVLTGSTLHNSHHSDNAGDCGTFGSFSSPEAAGSREGPGMPPCPPHFSIFRNRKEESGQDGELAGRESDIHKVGRRLDSCLLCISQEEKPTLIWPGRSHSCQRQDTDSTDPGAPF